MPEPRWDNLADDTPTRVVEWAVNLDDLTGELLAAATQTLLREGALDAWTTPIQMKKQRPGVTLTVLCAGADADRLGRRLLQVTGSFGARRREWDRLVLDRSFVEIDTAFGRLPIKVGRLDGKILTAAPEYDAVARLADAANQDVRLVMETAKAAAERWRQTQTGGGADAGSPPHNPPAAHPTSGGGRP